MLKALIAKSILFLSLASFAQNYGGDVILSVENKFGDHKYTDYHYYGLRLDAYANDFISFNYSLGIGKRHYDDEWQFETPLGATVGLPLFGIGLLNLKGKEVEYCPGYDESGFEQEGGEYDSDGNYCGCETETVRGPLAFGVLGVFLAIVPQGVSLNLPIGRYFKISPYVNFAGATISTRPDNGNDAVYLNYRWGFGSRLGFLNNKGLELGGYCEYGGVHKISHGFYWGLNLGYNFTYYDDTREKIMDL